MKVTCETKPCVACAATGISLNTEGFCPCCSGRGYRVMNSGNRGGVNVRQSYVNAFPVVSFAHLLNSNLRDDSIVRRVEGLAPMLCSFDRLA